MSKRKPFLIAIMVVFAAAFAVGGAMFMFPATPPLRAPITGAMEPIDARAGIYLGAEGERYLIAPALSSGFSQFSVDAFGATVKLSVDELADNLKEASLVKSEYQPYLLRSSSIEDNTHLEGWIFEPPAPKAAVVILHGSGDSDRENGWYVYLADFIAKNGFLVLLPDKRGAGRSDGDWRDEALTILAEDGAGWVAALRRDYPQVRSFGVIGVSQGGMIAPTTARLAGADFAIGLSVTATSLNEQLLTEVGNDVEAAGVPEILRPLITAIYAQRAKNRYGEFWRKNGSFDTLLEWSAWGGPFFVALGRDDDRQFVPVAESMKRFERAENPAEKLEWRAYDGVRHSLCYREGAEKNTFHRDFQRDLVAWMNEHARSKE